MLYSIVHRWRSLAKDIDPEVSIPALSPNFDRICHVGVQLVQRPVVTRWLVRRYPVVVVDELQDGRGDRLAAIKAIEGCCHMIAAADGFQDLDSTGCCEAVEWLSNSGGAKTVLSGSKRTKLGTILNPANKLRQGGDCGELLGYRLSAVLNHNAGAGAVARALRFNSRKDVVILTPTGPDKSPFVKNVVARLLTKDIQVKIDKQGRKERLGPYSIIWETSDEAEREALLGKLDTGCDGSVTLERLVRACGCAMDASRDLQEWAMDRWRKKGTSCFSKEVLAAALDRIIHSRRAFLPDRRSGVIRAMTINQAKNREFEGVIVLWPLATGGSIDSHRRKLYNAITRAKGWVNVVLQDSADDPRVGKPPFSKPPKQAYHPPLG